MNETDQQLAELIKTATAAGKDATSFIVEQAPDVSHQYIKGRIAVDAIQGSACLIALSVLVILYRRLRKATKAPKEDYCDDKIGTWAALVACIVVIFGIGAAATDYASDCVRCIISPKIVLLEGVKSLSK